jgi:phospholipase/carboxylesterase/glyoxalase family protein
LKEKTLMTKNVDFVHRFVPAQTKGVPTLLLLHGTGGNENDLLDLGRMLAPGAALLSPRGKVLEHGMPRFFRRLAEGVFDLEDLQQRTHELADWVQRVAGENDVDMQKIIAVGYSNGANIAVSMLLLGPGMLSAAVLLRPMVPLEPEPLPDLRATPIFIGAARIDQIVEPQQSERLAHLLEQAGADVTLNWHAGNHALSHEDVRAAQAWLQRKQLVT